MSAPVGGESSGLHAVDEINGQTLRTRQANYRGKAGAAVGCLTGTPSQPRLG